jgi:putative transposase
VRRTVPPSAEIEARIDQLLAVGVGDDPRETLAELARLGARLIIQRAVEDEFDAWLGRARYERRLAGQSELREEETGVRNGFRTRRVQTAEGELQVEIPQVRQAAETFASKRS